ncbi:MAG: outer membrane protein transport protein [Gammaproteobacteria bacterium]
MNRTPGLFRAAAFIIGMGCASSAFATAGYFMLGYGAKSMGMAGAVVSNPQDSIAAASNPAGMALVGQRVDAGLRFFSPIREAQIDTSAYGATFDVDDKSRRNLFLIPNIGFTRMVNDRLWWGFTVFGNGGLNSTYDRNIFDETFVVFGAYAGGGPAGAAAIPEGTTTPAATTFPGGPPSASDQVGTLGVDLAQSIQALSVAFKANDAHTIGASLLVGVQRFSARGLGNFQCFTTTVASNPGGNPSCAFGVADLPSPYLTDNNSDWSYGAGVRVGWIGDITPSLTLGASAASKIYMTEFDDYRDLFAEQGDLDIPANFALSATVKATPKLNLSFDFQRILYEGVASISNPGPVASPGGPFFPAGSGPLGADNGLGFGWEDTNIYRIGAEYAYDNDWTFRAGFAYNDQTIPADQVLFNILAPAVIRKHATLGFTYSPDSSSEWSFAYMHALSETTRTAASPFSIPGVVDVPAEISMYQNSVDLSYSLKF